MKNEIMNAPATTFAPAAVNVPAQTSTFVKGLIPEEIEIAEGMKKSAEEAKINIEALCDPAKSLFEEKRLFGSDRGIDDTCEEFYDSSEKVNIEQEDVYVALGGNKSEGYFVYKHIFITLDNEQTYYGHFAVALNKKYDFTLSDLRKEYDDEEDDYYYDGCNERRESNMEMCRRWRTCVLPHQRAEKIQALLEQMAFWMLYTRTDKKSVCRDELKSEIFKYDYDGDEVLERNKRKFYVTLEYNSDSDRYVEFLNKEHSDDENEYCAIDYDLSEQVCGQSAILKNGNSYHCFALKYCSERGRTFWTCTRGFEEIDGKIEEFSHCSKLCDFRKFAKYNEILLAILCLFSERSKTIKYPKNEDNIVTRIRAAITKLSREVKRFSDSLVEDYRAVPPLISRVIDDNVVNCIASEIIFEAKSDGVCPEYEDPFTGLYFERDFNYNYYPYNNTYEDYTDDQMLRRKYGYDDWEDYEGDDPEYDELWAWRKNNDECDDSWDDDEYDEDDEDESDDDFDPDNLDD